MILFLVICLSDLFLERILKVKLLIEQRKKFTVSVDQAFEREASITQEIIFFFSCRRNKGSERSLNGMIDDHRSWDGTKMDHATGLAIVFFALRTVLPYLVSSSCELRHEIA